MAMTEEEAKTKWCPFVRITPESEGFHPTSNREQPMLKTNDAGVISMCIGSHCMAWRWSRRGMVEVPEKTFGPEAKSIMSASDAALLKQDGTPVPDLGYCGLAGRL